MSESLTDAAPFTDGHVLRVNISPGGVPKRSVERAWVERLGLDGDGHHHDLVHGGPHRAVALMAIEAIERVRADGHPIGPGSVGENLTTSGIEIAHLPVGTRLAIGVELVLEISSPDSPCDVIKGAFVGGKSGRISILTHPDDTRMYARVLTEGEVRPGDPIRVLPAGPDSLAETHQLLDLLDNVEREAWLAMWRAAAEAGYELQILELGDAVAAACPELPGSSFNRAFGLRQIPVVLPRLLELYRAAGTIGWLTAAVDDPPWPGAEGEPDGVHVGAVDDVPDAPVRGLAIRAVDSDDRADIDRWTELFLAGFEIDSAEAAAWRRFNPALVRARGNHQFIAALDGRDVAASALFTRRRVGWLGAGTVLPEARGRGIQRALIADRARRAADLGCGRVMATADLDTVSAANLAAMGLPRIWSRVRYRFDPSETATISR